MSASGVGGGVVEAWSRSDSGSGGDGRGAAREWSVPAAAGGSGWGNDFKHDHQFSYW